MGCFYVTDTGLEVVGHSVEDSGPLVGIGPLHLFSQECCSLLACSDKRAGIGLMEVGVDFVLVWHDMY